MAMGRKRKPENEHGQPRRVKLNNGSWFYIDSKNKWHNLGRFKDTPIWKLHQWVAEFTSHNALSHAVVMDDILNKFETDHIPKLGKNTQRGYRNNLVAVRLYFGHMPPDDITVAHVYDFMEIRKQKKGAARANHEFGVLSSALTKGVYPYKMVTRNVCIGMKKLPVEHEVKEVTNKQFLAVYSVMSPMTQAAMWIYLLTGRRREELLRAKKTDILEEGLRFQLDKKKKTTFKTIEWSDQLRKAVQYALDNHPHRFAQTIICNQKGKQYTGDGFFNVFKAGVKRAIKQGLISQDEYFTIQNIRAKNSIDTESLEGASDRLGHTSLSVTKKSYRSGASISKPLF